MMKKYIYLLLFILATPFVTFAQMEEGNIRNDFHIGYLDVNGNNFFQQRFDNLQSVGLWTSNKTLITGSFGYKIAYNPEQVTELVEDKGFQANLNVRHYFGQNEKHRFFGEVGFSVLKEMKSFLYVSEYEGVGFYQDRKYLQLGTAIGLNKKIRQELYWEGKLNLSHSWDSKNDSRFSDIGLTAQIVNFAAFNPKESRKSNETLQKGTKMIDGTAFINFKNQQETQSKNNIIQLAFRPSYFQFVTNRLAVGSSLALDAQIGTEDTRIFEVSAAPSLRYYFAQKPKIAFFGAAGVQASSTFDGDGDYHIHRVSPTLQIGANYWIGKGLALEPQLSYGFTTNYISERPLYSEDARISVALKYFLTSKK